MTYTITKRFTFEASHQLPWHKGKCQRLHGHSYKLEVDVTAPQLDDNGIVSDFDDLTAVVNENVITAFDHHHLNDFLPNPTAELIAEHILGVLRSAWERAGHQGIVTCVRLWETEKCHVTVA